MPCLTNAGLLINKLDSSQATSTQGNLKSCDQISVIQAIRKLRDELIAKIDQKADAQSKELALKLRPCGVRAN